MLLVILNTLVQRMTQVLHVTCKLRGNSLGREACRDWRQLERLPKVKVNRLKRNSRE